MLHENGMPLDFKFIHESLGVQALLTVLTVAASSALDNYDAQYEGVYQRDIFDACREYMVEANIVKPNMPDFKETAKLYIEALISDKLDEGGLLDGFVNKGGND